MMGSRIFPGWWYSGSDDRWPGFNGDDDAKHEDLAVLDNQGLVGFAVLLLVDDLLRVLQDLVDLRLRDAPLRHLDFGMIGKDIVHSAPSRCVLDDLTQSDAEKAFPCLNGINPCPDRLSQHSFSLTLTSNDLTARE